MSKHIAAPDIVTIAAVVENPNATVVDRTFELPTGLYAATGGAYLVFMGLMAVMFHNGELLLPMAVIVFFIAVAGVVLSKWATMKPDTRSHALGWYDWKRKGIQTLSGPLDAGAAAVQVLILPVLIVLWGVVIAVIAATV